MFSGKGRLRYYTNYVVLEIDQGIVNYYYSLIPKYEYAQRQANKAHITVVRLGKEFPSREFWGYRKGDILSFSYNPYIHYEHPYFFIKAYSDEIGKVREKLGLSFYRKPWAYFHISIGNKKVG